MISPKHGAAALSLASFFAFQSFASATQMDQYELKGRMESVRTVYMLEPQIILGRRDEKHALYQGDDPGTRMAQRAIVQAATDIFAEKGYGFSSAIDEDAVSGATKENQQKFQTALTHLDQFADAGMEKKPKLWPFSIGPDQEGLLPGSQVDAIAFVQCYGKFDSVMSPDGEVPFKVASTVIQSALFGGAVIFRGDYASLEFKISVIDAKTGEMIFYRESKEADTDVRDKARLLNTFTAAFRWYLPKAAHATPPPPKFKHKRSEIAMQVNNGGVHAEAANKL